MELVVLMQLIMLAILKIVQLVQKCFLIVIIWIGLWELLSRLYDIVQVTDICFLS